MEEEIALSVGETLIFPVGETVGYVYPFTVTGTVKISFDGVTFATLRASVGFILAERPSRIWFRNHGAGVAAVTFALTDGRLDDRRTNVQGSIDSTLTGGTVDAIGVLPFAPVPTGFPTTADVAIVGAAAAAVVLAANANRKEAFVTNLAANADPVRVGDVNAGAARGVEVSPGQTLTVSTEAAVYVYSPSNQSVAVAEVIE